MSGPDGRSSEEPKTLRDAGRLILESCKEGWREGVAGSGRDEDWQAAKERWRRNGPSIAVDIGLGLVFFAVAKLTDLVTAAVVGALAGLALIVVQRFVRVDLLGGLALFGIVMMLLSAGYALILQDEGAIQYRPTVMGAITATLFLADSFFGGRYLAERLMRYVGQPGMDATRLARGVAAATLTAALANHFVVAWASQDLWLYYTTFGDVILVMALMLGAIRYAQGPAVPPRTDG